MFPLVKSSWDRVKLELDYCCENRKWRLNPLYVSILKSNVLCFNVMTLGKSSLA